MKSILLNTNRMLALMAVCMMAVWSYADNGNRLYFDLVKAAPGTQATLSIAMDNANEIEGFQFKLYLPEGVSLARKANGKVDMVLSSRADDQSVSGEYKEDGCFQCVATSLSHSNFAGNEGTIVSFTLNVDSDIALGEYELSIREIQLSTNNTFVYYDLDDYTGTVAIVDRVKGEDGYNLTITPFAFNEDVEIPFVMDNVTDITNVEFDVTLPEVVSENELYYVDAVLGKTKFTTNTDVNDDGSVHVSIARRSSNKIVTGEDTEIALLGLAYDEVVAEGKYTIEVNNIVLVDVDGNEHKATSYKADIYVGSPVESGKTVTFNGDYTTEEAFALFEEAISTVSNAEVLDLREVTALPEGVTIPIGYGNTMIYTSDDLQLSNNKNVVIGRECANLVVTDGYPFSSPKPFTAANASYSRSMTTDWGTICLPYAVESDENVQFYHLKSRNENSLVFTEVASLEAGQPGVFKRIGENAAITLSADNVAVVTEVAEDAVREGLKLVGTFEAKRVDVTDAKPSYYIKDNTFLQGVEYFNLSPFRAYFDTEGAMSKTRMYSIVVEDEATGIQTAIGSLDSENGDIYDVNGMKLNAPKENGIYIKNGKKFANKR